MTFGTQQSREEEEEQIAPGSGGASRRAFIARAAAAGAVLAPVLTAVLPPATAGAYPSNAMGSSPYGSTNFNVTDRVALYQLIYAYGIEIDRYNVEGWFQLFTPNAVFTVGFPGMTPVEQTGEAFRSFWRSRFAEFQRSGNLRKHLICNIVFVEQTDFFAHAIISGLITNSKDGKVFSTVSGVDYEGWFVKRDGVWYIDRWDDRPDTFFEG